MTTAMHFCIECNKPIKSKNPLMVNFDNAKGRCISPEKPEGRPEGQDYGLQYIGSECAKKLPKSWLMKEGE